MGFLMKDQINTSFIEPIITKKKINTFSQEYFSTSFNSIKIYVKIENTYLRNQGKNTCYWHSSVIENKRIYLNSNTFF